MGLKQDRPKITKSNIVCAEPMPGENEILKEFVSDLQPNLLGHLVEVVFDKMKLAGEAGSLLKIEEEIREAVAEAKRQWLTGPVSIQRTLFDDDQPVAQQRRFDFSGIGDAQFFEQAEAKVVEALRTYAEKSQSSQRLRRQLFTDDAVRGFAFVDTCHQRFDVVLMNPPFGIASKLSKHLIERAYPRSKTDVYAAFVERGLSLLLQRGLLGAITSRSGFFLTSFQKWRENILLEHAPPTVFADLGSGVLDTALVETAAYCLALGKRVTHSVFYDLRRTDSKAEKLVSLVNEDRPPTNSIVIAVDPSAFGRIPGSPFAYWVSERVRRLFADLPRLESNGRKAQKGAYTNDDFRFLRVWWEITPALTARSRDETLSGKRWVMLAKGGAYSPYYSDWEMVIDWGQDGEALKQFLSEYRGSRGWGYQWSAALNGYSYYFRPGVTWARRTQRGFNVRALPSGCIIGDKGPSLFIEGNSSNVLLFHAGVMNSACFRFLLGLQTSFGSFEVGVLEQTPVPNYSGGESEMKMVEAARRCIQEKQGVGTTDETSHIFTVPGIVANAGTGSLSDAIAASSQFQNEANQRLTQLQSRIDDCAFTLFNIDGSDRRAIEDSFAKPNIGNWACDESPEAEEEDEPAQVAKGSGSHLADCLSYCVGVVFGRWDVRCACGESKRKRLPDPFATLPVCSPATLQSDEGLPETRQPAQYPIRVCWSGIIPDDPDHADDILRRVRDVLELIWKDRAESIEKEACEILGVKELRDYMRKPGKGGFWDGHVSRYSKSRRKAPIYWLLQSSKKNYALWLYYHRLDKDMLFKALLNYVEPKVRLEQSRLDTLRVQKSALGAAAKGARRIDKDIERQEALLGEVKDFEEKLRRAANLDFGKNLDSSVIYDPDLNDGVVLNIAPLWELMPWKEAEGYWDDLLAGEYEWSSMGKLLRKKGLVK
jgi:hypothetical protein